MRALLTTLGIALFAGLLWLGARGQSQVECELCLTFKGRTECRIGAGADRGLAVQSARGVICNSLGRGVTDAMQCGSTPPTSTRCEMRP